MGNMRNRDPHRENVENILAICLPIMTMQHIRESLSASHAMRKSAWNGYECISISLSRMKQCTLVICLLVLICSIIAVQGSRDRLQYHELTIATRGLYTLSVEDIPVLCWPGSAVSQTRSIMFFCLSYSLVRCGKTKSATALRFHSKTSRFFLNASFWQKHIPS